MTKWSHILLAVLAILTNMCWCIMQPQDLGGRCKQISMSSSPVGTMPQVPGHPRIHRESCLLQELYD